MRRCVSRSMPAGHVPPPRRGAALIVALVLLGLLVIFEGVLFQSAASRRRQVAGEERHCQADWLAEAGVRRATARVRQDAQYVGESWAIEASELGGRDDALVRISIEKIEGEQALVRVHVEADVPRDEPRRARCARDIIIETGQKAAGEAR